MTPLDSGHCAGSAAFLFEGPTPRSTTQPTPGSTGGCGRVLATGDWRREDLRSREALPECLTRAPIDLLLLDNTYCHPRFAHPPRRAAAAAIAALVKGLLGRAPHHCRIVIGLDSVGKEELLEVAAEAAGGCKARQRLWSRSSVCCEQACITPCMHDFAESHYPFQMVMIAFSLSR